MRALVIEDNYLIAMDLSDRLTSRGYDTIDTASTEEEAVALARVHHPQIVTADFNLAIGTGLGAIVTLMAIMPMSVVFITSSPERVLEVMPDAIVISKPYSCSSFDRAISAAELRRPKS